MRRDITVTITAEGRDKGKKFKLTEKPAEEGERWATRVILSLLKSGAEIPDDVAQAGLAGIASLGFRAFGGLDVDTVQLLMGEMMECVQIIEPSITRNLTPDDIEEVATRLKLRAEVFALHTGFSMAELQSKLSSALTTFRTFSTTPISPVPSEPSSQPGKPA